MDRGTMVQHTKVQHTKVQHTKVQHEIQSSVSEVECYVCGKGLADGHSVSAKTLANGIVLFCDVHYSIQ